MNFFRIVFFFSVVAAGARSNLREFGASNRVKCNVVALRMG